MSRRPKPEPDALSSIRLVRTAWSSVGVRVGPGRWYADTQLDQARVVALLRRIGVPLAQIRDMLALDPAPAAEQIRDYGARTEMEHVARRELVGYLVDRLHERSPLCTKSPSATFPRAACPASCAGRMRTR